MTDENPNPAPASTKPAKKRVRPSRSHSKAEPKAGLSKTQKIVGGLALAALVAGGVVACFSIFGHSDDKPA